MTEREERRERLENPSEEGPYGVDTYEGAHWVYGYTQGVEDAVKEIDAFLATRTANKAPYDLVPEISFIDAAEIMRIAFRNSAYFPWSPLAKEAKNAKEE